MSTRQTYKPVRNSLTISAKRAVSCMGLGALAGLALAGPASASVPMAKLVKFGTFKAPVAVVQPPGTAASKTIWVVQKRGQIAVTVSGKVQKTLALDVGGQVSYDIEQGLLGLAFAPDYQTSHLAYVTYTDRAKSLVLAEYHGTNTALNPATKRVVLSIPKVEDDHNGGTLHFGPDGYLYLGTGDGGGAGDLHGTIGNAQDLGSLLGKMLRINPRASGADVYTVPGDNPFTLVAGARGEIWAYGLRNPWKWSFAPDGAIWIGDVGQDTYEEIDRVTAGGANLGWRIVEANRLREGTTLPAGLTAPIASYRHGSATGCAVTGGVTVTDSTITKLRGSYLYGDFCHSTLQYITWSGGAITKRGTTSIRVGGGLVTSIDSDQSGKVYISSLAGSVWRLSR